MSTVQEFDFSVNLLKALLWQHNKAEALEGIIRSKQDWYNVNQKDFWSNWYRDVFNLDTANDFGLSIWGRILGLPLSVTIESSINKEAFGFGTNHKNFNNGNFARARTSEQQLDTDQRRIVLKLRYFQLTSRGSVPEINEFLNALFGGQGNVYVIDSLDMSYATYFFNFEPGSQLRFILEKYDLLPRPAGVGVRYVVQVKPSFGFGVNHLNFENGSFGRL